MRACSAAFGFAWIPRESGPEALYTTNSPLSVRDRTLRNESMEVEIDAATGGIRNLRGAKESTPRLGQQLVTGQLPAGYGGAFHPLVVGLTTSPDRLIQIRRNRLLSLGQAPDAYANIPAVAYMQSLRDLPLVL